LATWERVMGKVSVLSVAILLCLTAQDARAQDAGQAGDAGRDDQATTLDSVSVHGSFLNTAAKSATKMDVDVMDTPFSVQSYSESFIDSIEATTLSDVFNYMTGVKRAGLTGMD